MQQVQKYGTKKCYIGVVVIAGSSLLIEFDVQVTVHRDKFL